MLPCDPWGYAYLIMPAPICCCLVLCFRKCRLESPLWCFFTLAALWNGESTANLQPWMLQPFQKLGEAMLCRESPHLSVRGIDLAALLVGKQTQLEWSAFLSFACCGWGAGLNLRGNGKAEHYCYLSLTKHSLSSANTLLFFGAGGETDNNLRPF